MKRIYKLRKLIQLLSFTLFLVLLLMTVKQSSTQAELYLRINPLLAISSMAAARALIINMLPSLLIVILTVVLGRVFCSWLCPMGFVIDTTDKVISPGKRKKLPAGWPKYKYLVLLFVLIVSVIGFQITGWLDPVSLLTRTTSTVIIPIFSGSMEFIVKLFYRVEFLEGIASYIRMNILRQVLRWDGVYYQGALLISLVFAVILLISRLAPRLWCRTLCPLGALLALFSIKSANTRKVSDKCTSCNACTRKCPMGAIEDKGKITAEKECIKCFKCSDICPENAISFSIKGGRPVRQSMDEMQPAGISRKQFILTSAGGVLGVLFFKTASGRAGGGFKVTAAAGRCE